MKLGVDQNPLCTQRCSLTFLKYSKNTVLEPLKSFGYKSRLSTWVFYSGQRPRVKFIIFWNSDGCLLSSLLKCSHLRQRLLHTMIIMPNSHLTWRRPDWISEKMRWRWYKIWSEIPEKIYLFGTRSFIFAFANGYVECTVNVWIESEQNKHQTSF